MPELPEVETTIRGLRPIVGSTILKVKIHTPKLRIFIPKNILYIERTKIINIKRRGKFIIINLNNKFSIIIHLGMSGRIRLLNNIDFQKKKHDHFVFNTSNDLLVVFNDVRKFGFVDYHKTIDLKKIKYFMILGKEALGNQLSHQYFFFKIRNSIVPIKQILLDQRIIAGIGNIYASEILFDAKVSPFEKGVDIDLYQCKKIIISTKKILKKAIKYGGSSLRDYVATDGTIGNFQNNFQVYNREGEKILGKVVKKTVQYGRSTYYCPELQKKK
tara:strand:- start:14 stop:832 length:819 start_codon:yes stop_codon:yes gene_type:complete